MPLMAIKTNRWILSVAFSKDGAQIVSGSSSCIVQLWDTTTGAELQQLHGHTDWVTSVAFSHDGTSIVSGSRDKSVWVWDASTGAALQQLNGHTDWVRSVAFSHDGSHIVSGSDDMSVRVWGSSAGAELQQLNGHTASGSDVTSFWVCSKKHLGVLWTSSEDGWIVSLPGQDRLVWMPQGIREVIYHPYNTLIISQEGYAHIDFEGGNIGSQWEECYKPLLV